MSDLTEYPQTIYIIFRKSGPVVIKSKIDAFIFTDKDIADSFCDKLSATSPIEYRVVEYHVSPSRVYVVYDALYEQNILATASEEFAYQRAKELDKCDSEGESRSSYFHQVDCFALGDK